MAIDAASGTTNCLEGYDVFRAPATLRDAHPSCPPDLIRLNMTYRRFGARLSVKHAIIFEVPLTPDSNITRPKSNFGRFARGPAGIGRTPRTYSCLAVRRAYNL